MDELAHGAVGKLIWEGAGTDKVSVATAADTTGYHNEGDHGPQDHGTTEYGGEAETLKVES